MILREADSSSIRRGAAIVYAMVVLAVLGILMSAATQHIVAARKMLEARRLHLQAVWLARSGSELAIAGLLGNENYTGENLELPPDLTARITVKRDPDQREAFQVTSDAHLPGAGQDVIRKTQSRVVKRVVDGKGVRIETGN